VATTITDEQGKYSFHAARMPMVRQDAKFPLSAGFQVFGIAPGYGLTWQSKFYFFDEPGPQTNPASTRGETYVYLNEVVPIDLTFRPAARVQGRFVDEMGNPLGQVRVALEKANTLTDLSFTSFHEGEIHALPESVRTAVSDNDGRFRLDDAPENAIFTLQVEHAGFVPMVVRLATTKGPLTEVEKETLNNARKIWPPATGDLYLTFDTSRLLTVQAVCNDSGKPIADAEVEAVRIDNPARVGAQGQTGAAGKVQLKVPPGQYRALVRPPAASNYVQTAGKILVSKDPIGQTAEIRVRLGSVLILEVVDAHTGKGIGGVGFNNGDRGYGFVGDSTGHRAVTDAKGQLRLVVPPGKERYRVARPLPDDYRGGSVWPDTVLQNPAINLVEGQTYTLQFELQKGPPNGAFRRGR
jgi:hypothetical protein